MTRDEHIAWCKKRAIEYVEAGNLSHAVANMASGLKTHPDTDNPALNGQAMIDMMYVADGDNAAVQRWIQRFSTTEAEKPLASCQRLILLTTNSPR